MDELIIRVLQGSASSSEQAQLQNWRSSAGDNERHYREIAALWHASSFQEGADTERPRASDIMSAAARGGDGRKRRRLRPRQGAAVAAALILGMLIGEFRPPTQSGASALEAAEFVTGPAELATARLSDGTVVRLAPSTSLRVRNDASGNHREVWLDGKAFFAVSSGQPAPFIVRTRAGHALVLGTRFEVDVTSEDLRVLVVEGEVEVGAEHDRIHVVAGKMSRTVRGLPSEISSAGDVSTRLDWMGSFLAFEDTPLHQVALEIENRYQMRVEVVDSALSRRTITAWFGDEEPETVLKVICRIADAHCSIRDRVASIEP